MNHFQRYLAEEFAEDFEEGRISRREALKLIASVTGSMLLANSILAGCTPPELPEPTALAPAVSLPTDTPEVPDAAANTATPTQQPAASETPSETATPAVNAQPYGTVGPDDPALEAGKVEFPDSGANLQAYLARPKGDGSFPVVLVCHENRGLTEHIQDVTRRLAKAGYVALAVDLLSRQGGTAALSSDQVPGALSSAPSGQFVQDFYSGWRYLQGQPFSQAGRLGMVGFCFGGGVTWLVATQMPELKAAVPFYGPNPPLGDVPTIQAAVLAIYGQDDTRITQGSTAIEEAMQQNNKIFEKVIYPNAGHAFFNDTGARFNPQAAEDAWKRTLGWFGKYV